MTSPRLAEAKKIVPWLLLVPLTVVALTAVILAPYALRAISHWGGLDWKQLSYVGQAYSGVGAVISAIALVGVGLSITLTIREGRSAREHSLRTLHLELLRTSLQTRTLLECWGPFGSDPDLDGRARHLYTNLILSHWQMMYELGSLSEIELRGMCKGFFGGETALTFWRDGRDERIAASLTRRSRRFHEIIDEEYNKTTSVSPAPPVTNESADAEATTGGGEVVEGNQALSEPASEAGM